MNEVYQANEKILRQRLGISNDAERVLIFAESSHWDPNWVWTSEQYFEKLVKRNLDLAIEALLKRTTAHLFDRVHVLPAHVLGTVPLAAG